MTWRDNIVIVGIGTQTTRYRCRDALQYNKDEWCLLFLEAPP